MLLLLLLFSFELLNLFLVSQVKVQHLANFDVSAILTAAGRLLDFLKVRASSSHKPGRDTVLCKSFESDIIFLRFASREPESFVIF